MNLNEKEISSYMEKFELTRDQIHKYHAEFLAYDTDGNGVIELKDLYIVNTLYGGNMSRDKLKKWINEG